MPMFGTRLGNIGIQGFDNTPLACLHLAHLSWILQFKLNPVLQLLVDIDIYQTPELYNFQFITNMSAFHSEYLETLRFPN